MTADEQPAGDQITTGDIQGVGIAIGTGAHVVIYGDVHYYPIQLRAPLRRTFDPLITDRMAMFAGREAALKNIGAFIASPVGGYLVVTAPAGFGKTALMAALVSHTPEAFAYHFFTPLYGPDNLREDFFLRDVVEQLAQWHGRTEQLPAQIDELRALYQQYLTTPLDDTRMLILDGLDEVTRRKLIPYLPRRLPKGLHFILTVRDVGQDWMAEYQLPREQTLPLPLGGLDRVAIQQVLRVAGGQAASFADDPALLKQIVGIAAYQDDPTLGADPFYIRLLAEDAASGNVTPQTIMSAPRSLDAYLDLWWQDLKTRAGNSPTRDLFGTLTAALGPIDRPELEAINPSLVDDWGVDFFNDVLREVRRFVVHEPGRGYALAHPRLHRYMRGRIKIAIYQDRLLAYCGRWSEHRSRYALTYYAQHLAEVERWEALRALLVSAEARGRRSIQLWAEARLASEGSYAGYLSDLDRLWEHADASGMLGVALRCALIVASICSISTNISPELLAGLVTVGGIDGRWSPEAALEYTTQMRDVQQQIHARAPLGCWLPEFSWSCI